MLLRNAEKLETEKKKKIPPGHVTQPPFLWETLEEQKRGTKNSRARIILDEFLVLRISVNAGPDTFVYIQKHFSAAPPIFQKIPA